MFDWLFSGEKVKPKLPTPTVLGIVTVDVDDLAVRFALRDGTGVTQNFNGRADYYPPASDRGDGVVIRKGSSILHEFMTGWQKYEFSIVGDRIVRYEDFVDAHIVRTTRSVEVSVRMLAK